MDDLGSLSVKASLLRIKLAEEMPGESNSLVTGLGMTGLLGGGAATGAGHFGQAGIERGLDAAMNKGWVHGLPGGSTTNLPALKMMSKSAPPLGRALADTHSWLGGKGGGMMRKWGPRGLLAGAAMYLLGNSMDKDRARDSIGALKGQVGGLQDQVQQLGAEPPPAAAPLPQPRGGRGLVAANMRHKVGQGVSGLWKKITATPGAAPPPGGPVA